MGTWRIKAARRSDLDNFSLGLFDASDKEISTLKIENHLQVIPANSGTPFGVEVGKIAAVSKTKWEIKTSPYTDSTFVTYDQFAFADLKIVPSATGYTVTGTITNNSKKTANTIVIAVGVGDANGNILGIDGTVPDTAELAPGASSPFSAILTMLPTGLKVADVKLAAACEGLAK